MTLNPSLLRLLRRSYSRTSQHSCSCPIAGPRGRACLLLWPLLLWLQLLLLMICVCRSSVCGLNKRQCSISSMGWAGCGAPTHTHLSQAKLCSLKRCLFRRLSLASP